MQSIITRDEDAQKAANTFVMAMVELDPKRRKDVWETFAGFCITQTFSLRTVNHVTPYNLNYYFFIRQKPSYLFFELHVAVHDWTRLMSLLC